MSFAERWKLCARPLPWRSENGCKRSGADPAGSRNKDCTRRNDERGSGHDERFETVALSLEPMKEQRFPDLIARYRTGAIHRSNVRLSSANIGYGEDTYSRRIIGAEPSQNPHASYNVDFDRGP